MKTYECSICYTVNHASHLHCQVCGTIPAQYSVLGTPARTIEHSTFTQFIEVVAAHGCVRSCQHHLARFALRTVALEYYAQGE